MRMQQGPQLQSGVVDIAKIQFDKQSRDDIPQILKGLQHIYINTLVKNEIFALLEKHIAPGIDKSTGRPGMSLWTILVMGVLRLDLNCDFDRLKELVNNHFTIRQMLGNGLDDKSQYKMQTLKDNVSLLTPELLEEINQIVVRTGHDLVKKKGNAALHGRCDSFVVETNVHYPTDINLLLDAMRKIITLTAKLSHAHTLTTWRQHCNNYCYLKRLMRSAQNKKRVHGKTEEQKANNLFLVKQAHKKYIINAQKFLDKSEQTLLTISNASELTLADTASIKVIIDFIVHAKRQICQIERRVLGEEKIPHAEKVFSIFEPHTEWISKGKAGVPVEFGLRVCVLEDQHGFIVTHKIMENQTDDQIAVAIVKVAKQCFPNLMAVSFDKGFHSVENQAKLSDMLELVALPRKGKLSQAAKIIESSADFRAARKKHSAVESAINALEVHGLDRCPDHGIKGFKRYVALAVVARNIQIIGAILQKREQKRAARKMKKLSKLYRLAA